MSAYKHALALRSLFRIAEALAYSREPDTVLEGLLDPHGRGLMRTVAPDPTSTDGTIDYCLICEGEPHGADCPVGMLEWLGAHGIDSDVVVPPNLSVGERGY